MQHNKQVTTAPPSIVHKVSKTPSTTTNHKLTCYWCRGNHPQEQCHFRNATCYSGGKKGHIVPVCRGKKGTQKPTLRQVKAHKVTVEGATSQHGTNLQEYNLFPVADPRAPPFKAKLLLDQKKLVMEFDMRASYVTC